MYGGERDTDVLQEILHRLPSNDLLHFKLVCKDWLRLISSPGFIQKHLERSKATVLLVKKQTTQILNLTNTRINHRIPLGYDDRFLGSCNGLVLYYKSATDEIGALNPCTGKFEARTATPLIHRDDDLACTWFGRHPATGEYVLVVVNFLRGENHKRMIVFKVYSLSRNNSLLASSTKELDGYSFRNRAPYFRFQKIGTFLHGRLHWEVTLDYSPALWKSIVVVYDFEAKIRVWTPVETSGGVVGVVDGCLCTYRRRGGKGCNEVMVMKEYGNEESWTKYADVEAGRRSSIPLAFCRNGDVIFMDGGDELKKCSFRDGERGSELLLKAESLFRRCEVIECTDSLVSPASVWTGKE